MLQELEHTHIHTDRRTHTIQTDRQTDIRVRTHRQTDRRAHTCRQTHARTRIVIYMVKNLIY